MQETRKNLLLVFWLLLTFTISAFLNASDVDVVDDFFDDGHDAEVVAEDEKGQWVPVPIPVSNPTVGTGLQAVLLYLHPRSNDAQHNTTSGIMGMYTDSESWATGIFHDDYWLNDRIRFTGALGNGKFNLKFYGIGDDGIISNNPIPYEFKMNIGLLKLQTRLPGSENWYGGIQYLFLDSETALKTSVVGPNTLDLNLKIKTAALGLLATYDTRDDNYYPTRGQWFEGKWLDYSENWGGDKEYNKSIGFYNYYLPVKDSLTLVLRSRLEASSGDVPFFDLPTLHMGGFSRDRYRDQHTISIHAEGRYKFRPRWGVIGFYEVGWLNDDFSQLLSGRRISSYGAGLRWQVTAEKKMNLGLDAAISTDDKAFYIQVGERF